MRLHRLRIQAFGPFAGTEEIDLDALSDAGLFLLHGPTGAGKSSVLDAVCFALYGQVPGVRPVDRLRSDHAAADLPPHVMCEFSVGSRRFEVTRSPAWDRPKRRGTGTTREQARVSVRELCEGAWLPRAQRLDEAGLLLSELLGMGVDSFTKLVLLPQGDFAAFLRADAEARRALLERLFGTDRFTAVQDWLKVRRAQARHALEEVTAATSRLLARADQVAAPVLPRRAGLNPAVEAGDDDPVRHVETLRAALSWARDDAVAQRVATQGRRAVAEAELAGGRAQAAAVVERTRLLRQATALAARADDHAATQARLRDHERCGALVPLVEPMATAWAEHGRAVRRLAEAVAAAHALGFAACDDLDDQMLRDHVARARGELGALEVLDREERALPGLRREVSARREQVAALAGRLEAIRRAMADGAAQVAASQVHLAATRTAAAQLPEARAELVRARGAVLAAGERDRLLTQVAAVSVRHAKARQDRDEARERWLEVRERRLDSIAWELAGELADGTPCRVCGSTAHPAPVSAPAAGAVTAEQEQAAQEHAEAAGQHLSTVEVELARQSAACEAAVSAAQGIDAQTAARTAEAAQAAVARAQACARQVPQLEAVLSQRSADLESARVEEESVRETLAGAQVSVTAAHERLESVVEAIRTGCGDDVTPAARRARLEREITAVEAVQDARARERRAREHLSALRSSAAAVAEAAGFAGLDDAVAAVLPPDQALHLAAVARRHEEESAAVAAGLAREEIAAVEHVLAPDVRALGAAAELAVADDEAAADRETLCRTACEAIDALAEQVRSHLARQGPLEAGFARLDELARCADGTGGDNARRMSLSAYVLAARLEEVAQSASVRLGLMSGGRYSLVHSDGLERGGRRSGLSLEVVDGWTGQHRPTSSLSGGETFYTALALALGLADVLSAEAAGTSIDTLFVDEGFGSLDEDTLEEVMDTLDALRSGGRAVGLVSHVADLQQRIPARLEVVKHRDGSTLRMTVAS